MGISIRKLKEISKEPTPEEIHEMFRKIAEVAKSKWIEIKLHESITKIAETHSDFDFFKFN